jgi:hypothetical protein
MTMDVWDGDTMFLVFEEDFRFREEGPRPRSRPQPACDRPVGAQAAAAGSSASSGSGQGLSGSWHGSAAPREPPASGSATASGGTSPGSAYQDAHRPPAAAFRWENQSQELRDIMCYINCIQRQDQAHFLWFCWQPANAGDAYHKPWHLRSGSMFVALDVVGAHQLREAVRLPAWNRGNHWDLELKRWLKRGASEGPVNARYLVPPMGNYTCHESAFDPRYGQGSGGRPSCWSMDWCCPGTRQEEDPLKRTKHWYQMGRAGGGTLVRPLPSLREPAALVWRSYWAVPGRACPMEPALGQRQPASAGDTLPGGSVSRLSAVAALLQEARARDLRRGRRQRSRTASGESSTTESFVAAPPRGQSLGDPMDGAGGVGTEQGEAAAARPTKRQRRQLRGQLRRAACRFYVEDRGQAASTKSSKGLGVPLSLKPLSTLVVWLPCS